MQASDSDLNDDVFINNLGLPDGASVASIQQGNPSVVRFHWQPELKDLGKHILTFTAADQKVASALPRSVTVEVIKPIISDVRIIDRVSTEEIDIEESTFTTNPVDLRINNKTSEIEWQYPTFEIGQNENIQFDLRLKNLQPGETRLVIHELELSYKDVNGVLVTEKLGKRAVQVAETVLEISTLTDRFVYRPQETVWVNTRIQKQSMGDVGACWDNAVVERFFGSLKHDWILKVHHATTDEMAADVAAYMRYYNVKRLHTANGSMSPLEYENYQLKVSI